ncbi:uncharacterized protein LOC110854616 [Folsomia candida]|nr:uncharacterized protein LOC110854616 [Folsomia candida]
MTRLTLFGLTLIVVVLSNVALGLLSPKLKKYSVDPKSVTVSGISSGGAMSSQFHYIYSNEVKGAGIFAAGPYLCAYEGVGAASVCMMTPALENLPAYIAQADKYSAEGKIAPTSNLAASKVYIFHGSLDIVVQQGSGKKLKEMYDHYGADVHAEFSIASGHGQPVNNGLGGPCALTNPLTKFVNECGYNGAYEMFKWLYGDSIVAPAPGYRADGELVTFDQSEFFPLLQPNSMASKGFMYVPKRCKDGSKVCRFHIAFHGCMANEQTIGRDYATKSQYDDVAELNDIVVLYPQTTVSFISPSACWDWFGYTGKETFATKSGAQPGGVYKMMKRVITGA